MSNDRSRRRIRILGVAIDDVIEAEALERIAAFIASGAPHHVVTINPEFVMEARHNAAFRQVLTAADLATPDGFGLLLVARQRGTPFRGRVTGVALTEQIAVLAGRSRTRRRRASAGAPNSTDRRLLCRFARPDR